MNEQNLNLIWVIGLVVTAAASFFLAGTELFDFDLSDSLTRILGIINLVAVPVLAWTTVKKANAGKE